MWHERTDSKYRHSSSGAVPVQKRSHTVSLKMKKAIFIQRFMGLLAGSMFAPLTSQVAVQMFQSSYGADRQAREYTLDDSRAMRSLLGNDTIRQSPLVNIALQGNIHPLNETLYLQQNGISSFQPCEHLNVRQQEIYSDGWQRFLYSESVVGTAYNFTFLNDIELIAPVVDCNSASIRLNDTTRSKFYFLTRSGTNREDLQLVTLAMAVQESWIPSETQVGSAAVASLTLINDLQATEVKHHFFTSLGYPFYKFDFIACVRMATDTDNFLFQLQTIPRNPDKELAKLVSSSYRSGFYRTSRTGRYNIRQQIWLLENNPIETITTWKWKSKNTSRNMWAWVHIFELTYGVYIVGNMTQMFSIIHQAYLDGALWCADGTIPMAKPFLLRGTFVLLFWWLTSFWDLVEYCIREAHEITGIDQVFSFTESMRLDFLNIMLSYASYLCYFMKDRMDGGVVFFTLFVSFTFRSNIIHLFPSIVESIRQLSILELQKELKGSSISPMQLRTPYAIDKNPVELMLYICIPIFIVFPVVIVVIILRKIDRRLNPKKVIISGVSSTSTMENMPANKSTYTNFELATGAELHFTYGIMSDFDNYIFIKGIRFASADGVYGAGFVIVDKKFLIQANDVYIILAMKLFRTRYANVHAFVLTGTTVQPRARLVYPNMLALRDLLRLGSTTLS